MLETPSLPSTGSRQMTNTNLITPPFCQHNDDGFQILFCHLFQSVSSNKNSHLPPFPCSVHSQIHSHFSLFPPPFARDPAPTEQAPSHLHTPTHLLVAVSGGVGLPLLCGVNHGAIQGLVGRWWGHWGWHSNLLVRVVSSGVGVRSFLREEHWSFGDM